MTEEQSAAVTVPPLSADRDETGLPEELTMEEPLADHGFQNDQELFRALYGPLRRFASFVGPTWESPDDLVQEALARALSGGSLTRLDFPEQYLRRTILNIAINETGRHRTRKKHQTRFEVDARDVGDPYPSDLADLEVLKPIDRAVVFMADVEGRTFAEIARELDKRESTIRGRAVRARRKLRDHLSSEED